MDGDPSEVCNQVAILAITEVEQSRAKLEYDLMFMNSILLSNWKLKDAKYDEHYGCYQDIEVVFTPIKYPDQKSAKHPIAENCRKTIRNNVVCYEIYNCASSRNGIAENILTIYLSDRYAFVFLGVVCYTCDRDNIHQLACGRNCFTLTRDDADEMISEIDYRTHNSGYK